MSADTTPTVEDDIDFDALEWAPGCGPQPRRAIPRFIREPGGLNWQDSQLLWFKYKNLAQNGMIPF